MDKNLRFVGSGRFIVCKLVLLNFTEQKCIIKNSHYACTNRTPSTTFLIVNLWHTILVYVTVEGITCMTVWASFFLVFLPSGNFQLIFISFRIPSHIPHINRVQSIPLTSKRITSNSSVLATTFLNFYRPIFPTTHTHTDYHPTNNSEWLRWSIKYAGCHTKEQINMMQIQRMQDLQ